MSQNAFWKQWILRDAPRYGVDPKAALAVASMEGLSGGVGDGGHAFGPFQMNDAGGVLTGRPGNHRAYAESRQGVDDALAGMARAGAAGKRGPSAIQTIVSRYERPMAPGPEIQGAISRYGGNVGGAAAPIVGGQANPVEPSPVDNRQELGRALIAQIGQKTPDYASVFSLARQPQQSRVASMAPPGATNQPGAPGVVRDAKSFLGVPYQWGGTTRQGIDCSALLQHVWAQAGVKIPRTTYDQWKTGTPVASNQLAPGDAVFFKGSDAHGNLPGHVGIYIGHGRFIEAPHTGASVRVSTLKGRSDYVGARHYG